MKKTIFALLLLVALVAVLAIPAMAAEGTLENHCVCGDKACDGTPSKADDEHVMQTWQAWDGTGTPKTSGYWYLTGDVNSSVGAQATFAVNGELAIDLNGHTIKGVAPQFTNYFFEVGANDKLTLTDYTGTGVINYQGTAVDHGNAIRVTGSNAVVNIYGGTVTSNNKSVGLGGACVALTSSSANSVVNMYGGVLENGSCTTSNAIRGGGNVMIAAGTFNMYGGTVRNGKASDGHKNGGNFFVHGGALNIWGGKVLGGEADRGSAIYSKASHVRLYGGMVTSGTTDTDLVSGVYFDAEATQNLILCGAQKIRLEGYIPNFVVENPVEVDLNGHTIGTLSFRFTNKKQVKVYDSKTADYTVADGDYGKINAVAYTHDATAATSTIARDFVNSDNQRYLVVKQNGVYSSHRIYLAVTHYVLADTADALNYKTVLKCDEVVAGLVGSNYGVLISDGSQTAAPIYYGDTVAAGETVKTTQLTGYLVKDSAANATWAYKLFDVQACIKVADDLATAEETINSASKTTSYADVIARTQTMELNDGQKEILKNIYLNYNVGDFMDGWWIRRLADTNAPEGPLPLNVGFGRVDITPKQTLPLAGMGDEATRTAWLGTETKLYATCIAVTDEKGNTVLLISSDSIRTEPWVTDEMRDTISSQLGVPRTNIISSTTHSHNTPDPNNPSYTKIFQDGCLEACRLAMADRKPAEMYTGTTYSNGLNFVRHYLMSDGSYAGNNFGDWKQTPVAHETEVDNAVQLIKFTRTNGKDIVMMNWRAHPIASSGLDYYQYSAGFIGHCRTEMEKNLGCHFAYFQGASGNVADVSEIKSEQKFTNMADQGKKLAKCAIDYMSQLKKVDTGLVEVKTVNYKGNIRVDSQAYIDAANTFKSMIDQGKSTAQAIAATNGLCNSSLAVSSIVMRQNAYASGNGKFTLELATISIGDVAFVSSPYEMFDNSGAQIKEGSPYEQTFVLYLANGRGKYIASEPAYTNGCYEKDNSYFVKGTAEELVSVYVSMLDEMYEVGVVNPTITTLDSKLPNDT